MANVISVSVLGDVKDINRKLGNVNKSLDGMGQTAKNVGRFLVSAFAGTAVIAGLKDIVGGASDLNETINKSDTIFGKSAASIKSWADGAASAMGLSKSEALSAASGFGNFFSQIGVGQQQTAKLSKGLVQAAVDLGSFHNASAPEVIDAMTAALRGEYDTLQKYIPTINAAAVEKKAMAMTGKANAKALTDEDKAMAVNEIVMKGLGKAQGDFAKTSDSLANKQKILAAKFQNVKDKIGTALLPIVDRLASFIETTVLPAFEKFSAWFIEKGLPALQDFANNMKDKLEPVVTNVGNFIKDTLVPALQDLYNWMDQNRGVVVGVGTALAVLTGLMKVHAAVVAVQTAGGLAAYVAQMGLVKTATAAWAAIQWVLNAAFWASPITWIIVGIVALIAIIILLVKNWDTVKTKLIEIWNAIKAKATEVWNGLKAWFAETWAAIKNKAVELFNSMKQAIIDKWNEIKNKTSEVWNTIKSSLQQAWDGMVRTVKDKVKGIVDAVIGIKTSVVNGLSNAASWLVSAGGNLIQGMINGVKAAAGRLVDSVKGAVGGAIDGAKRLLGIASPSKVFKEIGTQVGQGLVIGLDSMSKKVTKAGAGLAGAVSDGFSAPQMTLNARTASFAGAGSGAGSTVQITVNVPPTADKAAIGREIKSALDEWQRVSG